MRHAWAVVIICLVGVDVRAGEPQKQTRPSRSFLFHYAATIENLSRGERAWIWLPIPPSNAEQDVKIVSRDLPAEPKIGQEGVYGNRLAYIEARAGANGTIKLEMVYRMTRREAGESADDSGGKADAKFLAGNALVPINGKPLSLLTNRILPDDQMALGRLLYNIVYDHMEYRKDKPGWGRGDAAWACISGYGNCTDFHSLFISLARSNKIPSSFEIGFSIPEQRGKGEVTAYHCWAKFKPAGHGWVPVDISEAKKNPEKRKYYFGHLDENRVMFSTGRDLILAPPQSGAPVNFLVFPYVEVNEDPLPADRVHCHFSYEDIAQ